MSERPHPSDWSPDAALRQLPTLRTPAERRAFVLRCLSRIAYHGPRRPGIEGRGAVTVEDAQRLAWMAYAVIVLAGPESMEEL